MIFGEPPIGTVELAEFVIDQIRKLPGDSLKTEKSTPWTDTIKEGLAELGKRKGFLVSPDPAPDPHPETQREKRQGEYIHDVIWRCEFSRDILLAVESEWLDIDEVLYDFEKLMHTKSPLKLMVSNMWESSAKARKNNLPRLLERIVKDCLTPFQQHVCGETCLLVNFFGLTANAACYQFVADQDGKVQTASFTPLV